MKRSFFVGYLDSELGIRYTIDHDSPPSRLIAFSHGCKEQAGDEFFDKGFASLEKLRARLIELYPDGEAGKAGGPWGEAYFMHFVMELFMVCERVALALKS